MENGQFVFDLAELHSQDLVGELRNELDDVEQQDAIDEYNNMREWKKLVKQSTCIAMNELRLFDQFTDGVIIVRDGHFPVHRAVLSANSSYFHAQFTNFDMSPTAQCSNESQKIYLPDIDAEVFREIIEYAYIKKCNINEINVCALMCHADYMGIKGLIDECSTFLEKLLTPKNCLSIVRFAKFRTKNDLQFVARRYLLFHFLDVFTNSKQVLQMSADEFFDLINDDNLNVRYEDSVWFILLHWIDYDAPKRRKHIGRLITAVRTGLMSITCFIDELMEHRYVRSCLETRQHLIDSFRFIYDLDIIIPTNGVMLTPKLAMPRVPHEVIFAIGGWSAGIAKSVVETYDSRADRWLTMNSEDPAGPRAYHGSTVIGNDIYIIGGYDGVEYFNTCRVFDARLKVWKEIAPMHSRRCYVGCTQLNGLIYAIGGYDGSERLNTVERYDPRTNHWTECRELSMQRSDASACTLNGLIYVAGGFSGTECLNTVEVYNPITNVWTEINGMTERRSGLCCVALDDNIYAIGGFRGTDRLKTGERFNPQIQQWHPIKEMHNPRSNFGVEIIDNMIYAMGGFNGTATIGDTEYYVPAKNEWIPTAAMSIVRSALSTTKVADLPNIADYIPKDRDRILEERQKRLFANTGIIAPKQSRSVSNVRGCGGEDNVLHGHNSPNDEDGINWDMLEEFGKLEEEEA